jgi:glucose uptake protein
MWIPSEYPQALLMLMCSMLCWGSWANALKIMKKCRFEVFYWDFVFGTTIMSLVLAFTLGSTGASGLSFLADLHQASPSSVAYAFAGGVVFNVANIMLTAAIEVSGMAVAFPVGVGLSIVIGVVLNYLITPKNDPILLFGGVILLLGAIIVDATAYRLHAGPAARKTTATGMVLCLISGIGLGFFYPLVAKSLTESRHLGPYAVGVVFMFGMLASNLVINTLIMIRPVTGQPPIPLSTYWKIPLRWHLLGLLLGGAVWGLGTVFNFVAAASGLVGPATSFALGDGATMVSAVWGILLWKEFQHASVSVRNQLAWMFALFAAGLGSIALSPVWSIR